MPTSLVLPEGLPVQDAPDSCAFRRKSVEDAICNVLRESPGFIAANAGQYVVGSSPYSDDGQPLSGKDYVWPSMGLMPFLPGERPQSKTELEAWALERCRIHLPPALERMRLEWEKDERKAGDWSEVDPGRCLAMVESGLRFHLEEVERCFESDGGPNKEAWRQGERPSWPAPDGFPHEPFVGGHPLQGEGFVSGPRRGNSLGRGSLTQVRQVYHECDSPEHWFQGEYDLVYRWSERR